MNKQSNLYRVKYLLLASIGLLFSGSIYGWSVLKVPLAEYFGWGGPSLALNYTISMSFFCIGSLLTGWVSQKISLRQVLLLGAAMMLAGFIGMSLLTGGSIVSLYLSNGVLVGCGTGIVYNKLLSVGNAWFPDKKGTSAGILMMCFGLSSMLLGKLAETFFSRFGNYWQWSYASIGCFIALAMALCALWLKEPKKESPHRPSSTKHCQENAPCRDYTPGEMIRRPTFWIYYVYGILGAAVGSAVISFARELVITVGAEASAATTLVGILSLCNGLGRILCGLCFDRLGSRKTMFLVSLITVAAPAVMLIALYTTSLVLISIGLVITGLSFGANPTISSAFVSTFYGMKHYTMNYGISNSKLMFSSFSATVLGAVLTATGGYIVPFVILLGMALVSLGLCTLIRHP